MANILRTNTDVNEIFGRIPDRWLNEPPILHRNSKNKKGLTPFAVVIAITIMDMARNQHAQELLDKANENVKQAGRDQAQAIDNFKTRKADFIERMYPEERYADEYKKGLGKGERIKRAMSYAKERSLPKSFTGSIFESVNDITLTASQPLILRNAAITDNVRNRKKLLDTLVNDLTKPIGGVPAVIKFIDVDDQRQDRKRLIITVNHETVDGRKVSYTRSIWPLPFKKSSKVLSLLFFIESGGGWTDLSYLYSELDISTRDNARNQLEATLSRLNEFLAKHGHPCHAFECKGKLVRVVRPVGRPVDNNVVITHENKPEPDDLEMLAAEEAADEADIKKKQKREGNWRRKFSSHDIFEDIL